MHGFRKWKYSLLWAALRLKSFSTSSLRQYTGKRTLKTTKNKKKARTGCVGDLWEQNPWKFPRLDLVLAANSLWIDLTSWPFAALSSQNFYAPMELEKLGWQLSSFPRDTYEPAFPACSCALRRWIQFGLMAWDLACPWRSSNTIPRMKFRGAADGYFWVSCLRFGLAYWWQ